MFHGMNCIIHEEQIKINVLHTLIRLPFTVVICHIPPATSANIGRRPNKIPIPMA